MTTQEGFIEHKPLTNTAHYVADTCGRQAVTAQWLWDHPDQQGYLYQASDMGLDPWTIITGCDALTDGSKIILETGRTGEKLVDPTFEVFVSSKHFTG